VECVELAPAFPRPGPSEGASKLDALQTLGEARTCLEPGRPLECVPIRNRDALWPRIVCRPEAPSLNGGAGQKKRGSGGGQEQETAVEQGQAVVAQAVGREAEEDGAEG